MNKYCNIIDTVKTYSEGIFRSPKNFTIFEPALILSKPVTFAYSASVSKVIFIVLLMFNHKKTANGVFFKIVELTKQPLHLTIQNKEVE